MFDSQSCSSQLVLIRLKKGEFQRKNFLEQIRNKFAFKKMFPEKNLWEGNFRTNSLYNLFQRK